MPAYDDDQVTGESEGEFHSFTDHDLSDFSKLNSPVVESERQISVDPLSLKQQRKVVLPPSPPPLTKPKFVSASLPGSVLSSPKSGRRRSTMRHNPGQQPPHPAANSLSRQHSAASSHSVTDQNSLRWSKSCGEGRSSAPSDEFIEIFSRRPSIQNRNDGGETTTYSSEEGSFKNTDIEELHARGGDTFKCGCVFLPGRSFKKKQVVLQVDKASAQLEPKQLSKKASKQLSKKASKVQIYQPKLETEANQVVQVHTDQPKQAIEANQALNLHSNEAKLVEQVELAAELLENQLKQVIEEHIDDVKPQLREEQRQSFHIGRDSIDIERASTVSKAVSLERFDCGSWSSSACLDGDDDDEGGLSYFDLPLELIRFGHNDTDSPVNAAFVFEKDLKGVLKHSKSRLASRNSHDMSNRHVRFSTSMPSSYPSSPSSTCITPRLRKAREEFNAFLEAQSA